MDLSNLNDDDQTFIDGNLFFKPSNRLIVNILLNLVNLLISVNLLVTFDIYLYVTFSKLGR